MVNVNKLVNHLRSLFDLSYRVLQMCGLWPDSAITVSTNIVKNILYFFCHVERERERTNSEKTFHRILYKTIKRN